jgi:hypothetical protein
MDRLCSIPTVRVVIGQEDRKGEGSKMNKRYLPAIAAILIAMTCTTFLPVIAQVSTLPTLPTYIYAAPTLYVKTIAEDDQLRQTGIMWLATDQSLYESFASTGYGMGGGSGANLVSQYKILVSYNGVPVAPSSTYCQFVEKDKIEPMKNRQGPWETLATNPIDQSNLFVCKFRWGKPGVGVVDVYYIGTGTPASIADYVFIVGVNYAVGRSTVYGTDMQDLCLLGWPVGYSWGTSTRFPYTKFFNINALGNWKSCEGVALSQLNALGVPIQWS